MAAHRPPLLALCLLLCCARPAVRPPEPSPATGLEAQVADAFAKLSLEQRLTLLAGTGSGFETVPIGSAGVPALAMVDGPHGVRWGRGSTAFPTGIGLASTWNPALIERVGGALAREAQAKGRNVLLGPAVNIIRVPQNGRNFEYLSEDPWLTSRLGVAYVRGVQGQGVIATVKHFAVNNQERDRLRLDARVDVRALHEIYLPAFEAAVKEGGAMAIMAAYNKVNGAHCTANDVLLTDVLKRRWGFAGIVMSDWGAVHDTVGPARAGLDLEMPSAEHFAPAKLADALRAGAIDEASMNDKARRLLRASLWLRERRSDARSVPATSEEVALEAARESLVLLKNDRAALPLELPRGSTIAVIGAPAKYPRIGGGGSSFVMPQGPTNALDELTTRARARGVRVVYEQAITTDADVAPVPDGIITQSPGGPSGVVAEYFANEELRGEPAVRRTEPRIDVHFVDGSPDPKVPADHFSMRFSGWLTPPTAGRYLLSAFSGDGFRLFVDGKLALDLWNDVGPDGRAAVEVTLDARPHAIAVEAHERTGQAYVRLDWGRAEASVAAAERAARSATAAIVFVGRSHLTEAEGWDHGVTLSEDQEALIRAIARANARTIVVLQNGSALVMESWLRDVPAVLEAWFPGQAGGRAIAEALLGEINPSGRSPVSFLRRWEDSPAASSYPGHDAVASYDDGVFVGYRGLDRAHTPVTFPFGHGLSYTTFRYAGLRAHTTSESARSFEAEVDVTNTGERAGSDVVQLYVSERQPATERPPQELKAFAKVALAPGETRTVRLRLDARSFAHFDARQDDWVVTPGAYELRVGRSSRDVACTTTVQLR